MLYKSVEMFKHKGAYIRPGLIVELDDESEIKMLKQAKAIVDVERKIETAMKPRHETREEAFKQPIESHLNSKENLKGKKKRGRKKKGVQ